MADATRRRRRKAATQEEVTGRKLVHTRVIAEQDEIHTFTDEMEEVEVQTFESEPAYIRISAGVTKSLRQYESFRCDVALTMPCYPERIDETKVAVADWVSEKLFEEIDAYYGEDESDS